MVNVDDAPQHLGRSEGGAQGGRGRPPYQARPPSGGGGGVTLNIQRRRGGGEGTRGGVGGEPGSPCGWRYLHIKRVNTRIYTNPQILVTW